jgi:hypothetical protein
MRLEELRHPVKSLEGFFLDEGFLAFQSGCIKEPSFNDFLEDAFEIKAGGEILDSLNENPARRALIIDFSSFNQQPSLEQIKKLIMALLEIIKTGDESSGGGGSRG